ncbi:MAG: hypothetical protein GTN40_03485 [Candidatus Aenigmarchaeota archaeon]|nr:hypothetical protein [Candidatus Aenigmarchaeota archaeon]
MTQIKKERKTRRGTESKEFFYSKSLNLYIAKQPLKVDERIVKAAFDCGIDLNWDDENRVKDISYPESKKLIKRLGATLLSTTDYWKAYNDALKTGDQVVINQLQSNRHTEWLDAVFEKDKQGNVWVIEHPEIIETPKYIRYKGEKRRISIPEGRPGWFNPKKNINQKTGLPIHVDLKREKGSPAWSSATWKYWSVFKINELVAPIRGYVTSSGTPSLDLDIPITAKQPVLMLRECRKELLEPPIDLELIKKANGFIENYISTTVDRPATKNPKEHELFYADYDKFFSFLKKSGLEFVKSQNKEAFKIKEKFIDILGIIRIISNTKGNKKIIQEVDTVAGELFRVQQKDVDFKSFTSFLKESKSKIKEALLTQKRIIFVMGHKNPDTDTVISSLVEAYRNYLMDKKAVYIPVIQGSRIPDEVRRLLGSKISDLLLLTDNPNYHLALNSGQARWILVDQNVSEVQRFAISIIDHHILSKKAKRQDVSKTWEMVGSTSALITQKFQGLGLDFDRDLARILYGATLMDTENRSERKMTYKDELIMNYLKRLFGIKNDKEFYQDLMSYLLNTDDAELLFNRDYKQDWGIFGFAVAKVKNAFDKKGNLLKNDLLKKLVKLAKKNNKDKNFPLTIVKIADYLEDNEIINKERIYLIFNDYISDEFRKIMFEFVSRIIKNEFKEKVKIAHTKNSVDFWGTGDQLSRKVTAPFFEPVVGAFNEFYYSSLTKLYIQREFLKADKKVQKAAAKLDIELLVDSENRINNITYYEAKKLLDYLGSTMMSLSEYWRILKEAKESHDKQILKHLHSSNFVEFLDTIILDHKYIVDHPEIVKTKKGYEYRGEKRKIEIPDGLPGLIYPEDINLKTGFPKIVYPPNRPDKRLWRYWSPDAPVCIATRGHIFLLNQPSFDTKIHPDDALPNLGVRTCCRTVKPPVVEIVENKKGVYAKISKN